MHLVRDHILAITEAQREIVADIKRSGLGASHPAIRNLAEMTGREPAAIWQTLGRDRTDFEVTAEIARHAQTVLFEADLALSLRPSLERFAKQTDIHLPFDMLILQFDRPIAEAEFFQSEPNHWAMGDHVVALLLARYNETFNAVAWFASGELQRIKWLKSDPDITHFVEFVRSDRAIADHNARQLQLLAIACVLYMNCENVELKRVVADPKVNAKRQRKGKRPLPEYYVCQVVKTHYATDGEETTPSGRHVSFMFPVRGHFRRIENGRTIWVRAHYRGVEYGPESVKPKVYRVQGSKGS